MQYLIRFLGVFMAFFAVIFNRDARADDLCNWNSTTEHLFVKASADLLVRVSAKYIQDATKVSAETHTYKVDCPENGRYNWVISGSNLNELVKDLPDGVSGIYGVTGCINNAGNNCLPAYCSKPGETVEYVLVPFVDLIVFTRNAGSVTWGYRTGAYIPPISHPSISDIISVTGFAFGVATGLSVYSLPDMSKANLGYWYDKYDNGSSGRYQNFQVGAANARNCDKPSQMILTNGSINDIQSGEVFYNPQWQYCPKNIATNAIKDPKPQIWYDVRKNQDGKPTSAGCLMQPNKEFVDDKGRFTYGNSSNAGTMCYYE